ncbi:SDR family NAD(P)-dependent oxidoreductase [Bradyrhizobium elkanii]|uniref:SDR family NAD(P)-dependent oxidoreductase n=1 Tax=Bradyrhizobium elkanii TaxID=29448 RepID=UPI0021681D0A|nr:SDR family NAD(P)-dependent oxidoreductase [Bradyrhizobium elkanii]MCS3519252.1 NAD(P)-dependent dehydrogenase (short-subunit alcohol dehydrogenase family) [Bradyrhizobium elkanii]MCS4066910.1 NAD(P)-dependent dehydrogenase (short-subunit alcohol dehydrogenase family) [Bradyrhizobium elkanii]MCS4082445.1 NAD(P)-dependent dehydrogenase (short-subunit alcohol dehydrogenase family) [Bradyrhizobium elkanii]MCW2127941.1 NAD(P)-dependent dehydrogenase (short-subunit alcohol dehydrogenase family) [
MTPRYPELRGRRVLVTGAASGIGYATACRFVNEGARVIALDVDAKALAASFPRCSESVHPIVADVADYAAMKTAFGEIEVKFGGLDAAFANAGISIRHAFLDITIEEWRRVVDVNLHGVFHTAQLAARSIVASGGGTLILMGSTNGMSAHPYYADYNATKAGVILLARTMALELAPNVRVNALCPGYVLTPMQRAEYTDDMLAAVNAKIPLRRHAAPEEVAALVAFLASDEAAYITGQHIPIDGGETA